MQNYTILIGTITKDFKETKNNDGKDVTILSLAVSKTADTNSTDVYNIDATMFSDAAINAKNTCKKGDMVAAKGRLSTKQVTLEGGINTTQIELIVEHVMPLKAKTA